MRKRIGAKILSVFMLILVICLAGIGIVTVQVKNMDKINQNIGNEYLDSIQEVNTLSVNEAYLEIALCLEGLKDMVRPCNGILCRPHRRRGRDHDSERCREVSAVLLLNRGILSDCSDCR